MAERQQRVQVRDLRDAPNLRPAAQPVRGYFPEQPKQLPDSDLTQVANALADVNPAIQRGLQQQQQRTSVEDIAEAERKYREAKKPLREAIKDGTISEGQSPAFRRAWQQSHLRVKGKEFGSFLREQYANSPVSNSTDPQAAADFAQEQYDAWIEQNEDIQSADDIDMAEAFLPEADRHINQLVQQHQQRATRLTEERARESLGNEITMSVGETLSADTSSIMEAAPDAENTDQARYSIIADNIQQRVDSMVENGMNGSDANKIAIESLATYQDPDLMREVLNKVNTGSGPLGRTKTAREMINRVEDQAVQREMRDYRINNQLQEDREERNRKAAVDGYISSTMEALSGASPSERVSIMQDFDPIDYANNNGISDNETIQALLAAESRLSSSATDVQEDPEAVRSIYERIATDPGSVSKEEIINGIGQDYSFSRGRQLMGDLDAVTDSNGEMKEHPYLSTGVYRTLESSIGDSLKSLVDMGGVPAQNAANATVDFRTEMIQWLEANPEASRAEFRNQARKAQESIISTFREKADISSVGTVVPSQVSSRSGGNNAGSGSGTSGGQTGNSGSMSELSEEPISVEQAQEMTPQERLEEFTRIRDLYENDEITQTQFAQLTRGIRQAVEANNQGGEQ